METKPTKIGTREVKEYLDRWWKPLINPPVTNGEYEASKRLKENK